MWQQQQQQPPAARVLGVCAPSPKSTGKFISGAASPTQPTGLLRRPALPQPTELREQPRRQQPPQRSGGPLEVGAAVVLSDETFHVTDALGRGSFGAVWRARSAGGRTVAIKEVACASRESASHVLAEAQMLRIARQELQAVAEGERLAERIPSLFASTIESLSPTSWRVRLVMSEVRGSSLEYALAAHRRARKGRGSVAAPAAAELAHACRCTCELVVQIAPVLENISAKVYHRDVSPRNIQVEGLEAGEPKFGLVDFGLAVDAERWRAMGGFGDLGGDGRYWPPSAWFAFCRGRSDLRRRRGMCHEFATRLDAHSLGIAALRCFVELLPPRSAEDAADGVREIFGVQAAWRLYWADVCGHWKRLLATYRAGGGFEALRDEYAAAAVHREVAAGLRALRRALAGAAAACQGATGAMAGMPLLFESLLSMVRDPDEDEGVEEVGKREGASDCGAWPTDEPDSASTALGASPHDLSDDSDGGAAHGE